MKEPSQTRRFFHSANSSTTLGKGPLNTYLLSGIVLATLFKITVLTGAVFIVVMILKLLITKDACPHGVRRR